MKNCLPSSWLTACLFRTGFALVFVVLCPAQVSAATLSWTGGTGNWNTTDASWSGAPWSNASLDIASFGGEHLHGWHDGLHGCFAVVGSE